VSEPYVVIDVPPDQSSPWLARAWRRFFRCRWDQQGGGICLRRRWHRGDCEGFLPETEAQRGSASVVATASNPYYQPIFVQNPIGYAGGSLTSTPIPVPEDT
jgi:hypothetical protein